MSECKRERERGDCEGRCKGGEETDTCEWISFPFSYALYLQRDGVHGPLLQSLDGLECLQSVDQPALALLDHVCEGRAFEGLVGEHWVEHADDQGGMAPGVQVHVEDGLGAQLA